MKILIDNALYTELVGAFREAVNNLEMFSEHDDDLQAYFYDLLEKIKKQDDSNIALNDLKALNTRVVKTLKDFYTSLGELMIAMDEDLDLFKEAKEVHSRALEVINELEVAKNG